MEKKPRIIDSPIFRYAIYFLLLLPLLLLREATPTNELKYLEIADEALRDGHFWCLFYQGLAYADKPPLYIWIIMLFRQMLGSHCIWLLELFSLIPALATMAIFSKWCGDLLSKRFRIAAERTLLTSAYFLGGAVVLRMDMLMVMFITLAMYTFWRILRGDDRKILRLAFPLYVFMAIFSKGPVGILVPLVCIPIYLICTGRIKEIGKVWGWRTWLTLAILCGAWWICVYLEGGKEYLNNLLFHQTFDRAVDAFHHKRPWYFYCYSIWYAMGPWALLTIPTAVIALVKKEKLNRLTKFFLIVSATFFVMMSAFSAKLEIYLLPMFGFVTYAAYMILQGLYDKQWSVIFRRIMTIGSCVMLLAVLIISLFFSEWLNGLIL